MVDHSPSPAVLVVDDSSDICRVIKAILRIKRISCDCADSGGKALAWLGTHKPGLVLLDLSMPDLPGDEVLRLMRVQPRLADVPVILHSAMNDAQVYALAEACGADGVLLKGRYSVVDVLDCVHNHVPSRHAAAEH